MGRKPHARPEPRHTMLAALLLAVVGTWLLLGCRSSDTATGEAVTGSAQLPLEPCRIAHATRPVQCGRLAVFENREARSGRRLELRVVVMPAQSRHHAPDPLVLLAGGPGQGAIESWAPLLSAFAALARDRDIVLVDQRGTGQSAPLDCDMHTDDLRRVFAEDAVSRVAAECRAGLQADLTRYNTPSAADDLDEVRAALGYDRLNLVGVSYGTRLALVYLRRHPARVRTVVLDGVAPTSMALPLWAARDGQRALDLLVAACEKEPACREAYPELADDFVTLLDRLEREPAQITIPHPRTGEATDIEIGRDAFAGGVHGLLYAGELASLLPYTVSRALQGDFEPFVSQVALLAEEQGEMMSLGLHLSVLCSEDVDRIASLRAQAQLTATFLGDTLVRDMQRACAGWPRSSLPEGYAEPTRSDRPVLVLSGEIDPVTPPSWGAQVLQNLPAGRHVIVPNTGHGAFRHGCVPELLERFVRDGRADDLDVDCVKTIRRPPFFIDFAGPVR